MPETERTSAEQTATEKPIITIERNGRTFLFIDHYSPGQTYADIVKSALRREFESEQRTC
jgi:uncharacterized membrane protein YvbJ